ncbi:MAG: hypothetical protein V6S10_05120 [Candidatus Methanoglobus sp.]
MLNAGVAIANEALTRIEMPSEVLANVLFETINRLNLEQFGKTISAVSSIVNKVHEGNYILGRGDRKFKEVAEAAMERLVNSVNMEEIVRAIKAFFDDLNDLSDGLNAALWKNPLNMMVLAPLLPAAVNTVSGLTSKVLSKFNELPPDLSAQIVTSLISEIDTKRLGEILTGIAKLVNAVSESQAVFRILRDGMTRKGIPVLKLDGDCWNRRITPVSVLQEMILNFVNDVVAKGRRKRRR